MSRITRRVLGSILPATALLACGVQAPTAPPPNDVGERPPVNILAAFHQIGCTEMLTKGNGQEVVIPARDGGRYKLDCPGASEDQIAKATQAYYQQFGSTNGDSPGITAAPGFEHVTIYYTCEVETTWEYWPEWGDWLVVSQTVNWCRTWRVYHNDGGGNGTWSGGSGGSGGPANPTVEPVNPPDPAPGDSMTVEHLNAMEVRRCLAHPIECAYYITVSEEALDWARYHAQGHSMHNNIYDARRHAFWSLRLTETLGAESTEIWTDLHEWNSRAIQESCMDSFNNEMGRAFAAEIADSSFSSSQKKQYVVDNSYRLQESIGC